MRIARDDVLTTAAIMVIAAGVIYLVSFFEAWMSTAGAPPRARPPPNGGRRKNAMPRDFTFEEAAMVVVCVTIGLICGFGGLIYLVRFVSQWAWTRLTWRGPACAREPLVRKKATTQAPDSLTDLVGSRDKSSRAAWSKPLKCL